jgi:hypothetical protein
MADDETQGEPIEEEDYPIRDEPIDEEYHKRGQIHLREPLPSFPGDSDWKVHSDWRDLHLAIQRAAKKAAQELNLGPHDEVLFDVSHIRVLVGNPNVKIYSVILTKTPGGGS